MFDYLYYIFGYAELNEYDANEKSKRLKYLCCETIKRDKIKLKKVYNAQINYDFPALQKNKKKRNIKN